MLMMETACSPKLTVMVAAETYFKKIILKIVLKVIQPCFP